MSDRARTYRVGAAQRAANRIMATLIRWGAGPRHSYLLTTVGRRTGAPHTNPVTLVETAEGRWLVAPYGPVSWVHNARAAGRITLRRGRHEETCAITELAPGDAAPVLKAYVRSESIVRPYFAVGPDASVEEFVVEAPRHPVFRLDGVA